MLFEAFDLQIARREGEHGVLENRVLYARLAELVAQVGHFLNGEAAIVDQHDGLRAGHLVLDVGDDGLFDLEIPGHCV